MTVRLISPRCCAVRVTASIVLLAGTVAVHAGPSIVWSGSTNAEIPLGGSLNLDLDGNGDTDFTFSYLVQNSRLEAFATGNGADFFCTLPSLDWVPIAYPQAAGTVFSDNPISPDVWHDGTQWMIVLGEGAYQGPWQGATGEFLGVRFMSADSIHYGWVEMTVPEGGFPTPIMNSYAYETTPNMWIEAGAVPEPATWALMLCGGGLLMLVKRRSVKR